MLCTKCNKNTAVVFITKYYEGKQVQEGLCLKCAKELGINPLNDLLNKTGMTEEDIESLNEQMGNVFEEMENGNLNFEDLITAGASQMGELMGNMPQEDDEDDDDEHAIEIPLNNPPSQNGNPLFGNGKRKQKNSKKKKFLDNFGVNVNQKALNGQIDRVIGREKEIDRLIQILNRRAKNNPCLLGEPGVGKTAIAEGLAVKIVNGEVPEKLLDKEIYLLDMTAVVAGTQFRGQFESRMRGLIEEAGKAGNVILVIDEIHNIMGAGDAEGSMNAANILKPALARGDVQVIGATTLNEYRKHIEKDSALERRFQPIIVEEPSKEESVEILKGIKEYYENHHRVKISDAMVTAAVDLSERYITDRFLPDKAIDVLDEAGSSINLKNKKLVTLELDKKELISLKEELDAMTADGAEADYQRVAELKARECQLQDEIKELEDRSLDPEMTLEDIATVIETWTKIPVKSITQMEAAKLIDLEKNLHKRIIGQEDAVKNVARAIRRSRSGFKTKKKPSSFIFIGPTGVGKTELVKTIAKELFHSEEAIIRFDMSEFMEKHTVSKLIGSPPGYVGYDDAGQLTEKVRRKPYSVILLDEIEKAHPDVFNVLLQILDDGRLTDSHGKVVSFENTIIIMTSNAGAHLKSSGVGFNSKEDESIKAKQLEALKQTFRPEFLNRVDEISVFSSLTKDELRQILELMINEVKEEAMDKHITFELDADAKEWLLDKGYDPKYGARPLRRALQTNIEDELAEMFLREKISYGSHVQIKVNPEDKTKLLFEVN